MEIYCLDFIQIMVSNYVPRLITFTKEYDIEGYFKPPIDHIAFKVLDDEEYERALTYLQPHAYEGYETPLNERRIATIILKQPVALGPQGECSVLELMEPKVGRPATTYGELDHIEIYKNIAQIKRFCQSTMGTSLVSEYRPHQGHDSLEMKFPTGQEVKFTTVPLLENVQKQVAQNITRRIF